MREKNWWINYPWRMVQTNLREIDMENINAVSFAQSLADYNATVVTLNAAGILASYETKLGFQKKSDFLHGDSLKAIIDECHKAGIKVIARCDFSKVAYSIFKDNEGWAYRRSDGNEVNYNGYVQTCVNSEYQQRYIFDILRELFSEHDFDGIFCNMSGFMVVDYDYNYHGPCHCDNCKRLFKEQFGEEIPEKDDPRNPAYGKYVAFKNKCTQAQKKKLYEFVKSIDPAIAVNGFDYQRSECNQDMDRPTSIYAASTNARKISGYMKTSVCDDASTEFPGFRYRHTAISPAILELRQWQNLANAGSTSVYIMGDIEGHKDMSGLNAAKKAFDFFAEHEELFKNVKSGAEVLLLDKPLMARTDAEVDGFIRILSEAHIPFDEAQIAQVNAQMLEGRKLVILPDVRKVSEECAALIDDYVKNGGVVIGTGASGTIQAFKASGLGAVTEKRDKLMSSIYEIRDDECEMFPETSGVGRSYIMPGSTVYVPEITAKETMKTYMALVPEQKYGPPEICYSTEMTDIPGIYVNSYGEGCMVTIPWLVGTVYSEQGQDNTFTFMKDVLNVICGVFGIAPTVSPMCEFTVMIDKNGDKLIHIVNTSGCFGNSFFAPLPMFNLEIDPKVAKVKEAEAYNGGHVSIIETEGRKLIVLDRLDTYEVIRIK